MKPLRTATLVILPVALVLACQLYPFNRLRTGEKAQYREDAMTTGAGIIPRPARVTARSGSFDITPNTMVIWNGGSGPEARSLASELSSIAGFSITAAAGPESRGAIVLSLEKPVTGAESYELSVEKNGITLTAPSRAGLFLGTQTIRQLALLARQRGGNSLALPCMEIEDAPRFSWRGLNLDCARHFPQKETVMRLIDLMALYRMNVLHLHLTDDQGWRLEIKKYPELTSVGAWRKAAGGGRYGGFYTQDDMRQIVAYAAARHVTVIPEIEMPGHCQAALAAYPELSCTGKKFPVSTRWGIHKEIYCAGKEETFRFLQDVLDEVMAIFPSPYIHVGGDECLKPRWKRCPLCQARIASEKLGDTKGLQSYFIRRMERYISDKGRKLIGWDEILEGGLAPRATVQSWRGFQGAVISAKSGHDTIVSPTSHAYFDYGLTYTNLAKVYSFEPVPPTLTAEETRHVLGSEACMWTEFTPPEKLDAMLFPRMMALSEVLWSPAGGRDFSAFHARLKGHYPVLRSLGVSYGGESEPVYARIKYQFRLAKVLLSIIREDPEAAMENMLREHTTD